MAGFIYFVPNARAKDPAVARLGEIGRPTSMIGEALVRITERGPNDQPGALAAADTGPRGKQARSLYMPDEQTWVRAPGADWWLGYWNDRPPCPEDLERARLKPGHKVALADGNKWTLPVARALSGRPAVPQVVRVNDGGAKVLDVVAADRALWERALAFWDEWQALADTAEQQSDIDSYTWVGRKDGVVVISIDNCFDAAVELLAINYRVGEAEISALELLTTDNMIECLLALVDWPSLEALEKKAVAVGSAT